MPTELARRTSVDISVDGTTWLKLIGKNDVQPTITPNKQDSSTYETNGWGSSEITMQNWSLVVKLFRESDSSNVLDPAQQLLVARIGQFGSSARIYVRWYDNQGRADQSWSGYAIVEFANSKTGVADLDEDTFTFTGDGILTPITNPYASASVPVVLSATPSGVAVGGQVRITGQGFAGTVATTGVKFNSVNATSWIVDGDTVIYAIMPAGSAGTGNIVVTNATGASTPAYPYTRGA
jgi:hypothetical protein